MRGHDESIVIRLCIPQLLVASAWLCTYLGDRLLGLVIAGHHSYIHRNRTECRWLKSTPQLRNAFFSADTDQGIKHVLVAALFGRGFHAVCLHAHEGDVERSADDRGQGARSHGAARALPCRQIASTLLPLHAVAEFAVQAKSGSTIYCLAHNRRRKAARRAREILSIISIGILANHCARIVKSACWHTLDTSSLKTYPAYKPPIPFLAMTSLATAMGEVPLGINCMRVFVRSIGCTCESSNDAGPTRFQLEVCVACANLRVKIFREIFSIFIDIAITPGTHANGSEDGGTTTADVRLQGLRQAVVCIGTKQHDKKRERRLA